MSELHDDMKINVPTFTILPRVKVKDKVLQCNLNVYRNTHHRTLAAWKIKFAEDLQPELDRWKKEFGYLLTFDKSLFKMRLVYTITAANKRKFDINNFVSIIDKFTSDCLVKNGFMKDDDFNNLTSVEARFGGITGERTCTLEIFTV